MKQNSIVVFGLTKMLVFFQDSFCVKISEYFYTFLSQPRTNLRQKNEIRSISECIYLFTVGGHWVCFQFGAVVYKTTMNIHEPVYVYLDMFCFLLGNILEVRLLHHMVSACLTL